MKSEDSKKKQMSNSFRITKINNQSFENNINQLYLGNCTRALAARYSPQLWQRATQPSSHTGSRTGSQPSSQRLDGRALSDDRPPRGSIRTKANGPMPALSFPFFELAAAHGNN